MNYDEWKLETPLEFDQEEFCECGAPLSRHEAKHGVCTDCIEEEKADRNKEN